MQLNFEKERENKRKKKLRGNKQMHEDTKRSHYYYTKNLYIANQENPVIG